jgi:hypothetical protein
MKRFSLLVLAGLLTLSLWGQDVELKTNLLYLATSTPNIGVEWKMNRHYTASLMAAYNPFRFAQYADANGNTVNPKLHHWLASAETRYWFCESFLGWNVGINVFGGEYNAGGIRFIPALKERRYKGWATGAGLTVGYQFPLSMRWSLDFSAGLGYLYTRYNRYSCYACGDRQGQYKRNYLGPTKAAISLVYSLK